MYPRRSSTRSTKSSATSPPAAAPKEEVEDSPPSSPSSSSTVPPPPPQENDGWPPALNESVDENGWPVNTTTPTKAAATNNKVVFDMQLISSIDETCVTPTAHNKKRLPVDVDVASTMNAAAYINDASDTDDDDSADKKRDDPPSNKKKDPPSNIMNQSSYSTPSDEDDELKVATKTIKAAELNTTDVTMNTTATTIDIDDMMNNSDYILDTVSDDSDPNNNNKHHHNHGGGDNDLRFRMEMNTPPIAAKKSFGKGQSVKGGKGSGGSGRHVAVISPDQGRRGRSSSTTRHYHRRGGSSSGGGLLYEDDDYEDDICQDDRKHHRSQSARRHDRSSRNSNRRSNRRGGLFSCGDFEEDITDTLALITSPMRNFRKCGLDDTKSLHKAVYKDWRKGTEVVENYLVKKLLKFRDGGGCRGDDEEYDDRGYERSDSRRGRSRSARRERGDRGGILDVDLDLDRRTMV